MSAFAVIYEDFDPHLDSGVFNKVMEHLSHRGPDGSHVVSAHGVIMGHWHFWTTPEEVGECQPLELNGLPFKIVLDGRIDNREELFSKLNIAPAEGKLLSDAALIICAYAEWHEDCFKQFVGEYALVIFDGRHNEIICARDPLGERTLFYAIHGAQIIVASEPWPIANISHPEADEVGVAHYFAWRVAENGQTMFRNVYEIPPAHIMKVGSSNRRVWRYWQPNPDKKIRYKTDEEYAEHFRILLEESVRCRLRSTTPVGVLMSGGMDSPSVAGLAAQILAPARLTTISHVFDDDELKECDERVYIEDIKNKWKLNAIYIPCDDAWPLKDHQDLPINKNCPDINAYRWMKEREYRRARLEGLRVIFTGGFGDHLFSAGMDWLADLLDDGKLWEAVREVIWLARHVPSWKRHWRAGYLQRAARRMLNKLPGGKRLRRKEAAPSWLTPFSAEILSKTGYPISQEHAKYGSLLALSAAKIGTTEAYYASRHTLELRYPYRDRRLIEFVIGLPAYQLFHNSAYKHILRTAMQGILPESVRVPRTPTSLAFFFFRGMEREKNFIQDFLNSLVSNWRVYVDSDWVIKYWHERTPAQTGIDALMPWMLISYEAWSKSALPSEQKTTQFKY